MFTPRRGRLPECSLNGISGGRRRQGACGPTAGRPSPEQPRWAVGALIGQHSPRGLSAVPPCSRLQLPSYTRWDVPCGQCCPGGAWEATADALWLAPLHHLEGTLRKARPASSGRGDLSLAWEAPPGSLCSRSESKASEAATCSCWPDGPLGPLSCQQALPAMGSREGWLPVQWQGSGPASPQGRPGAGGRWPCHPFGQDAVQRPGPKTPMGSMGQCSASVQQEFCALVNISAPKKERTEFIWRVDGHPWAAAPPSTLLWAPPHPYFVLTPGAAQKPHPGRSPGLQPERLQCVLPCPPPMADHVFRRSGPLPTGQRGHVRTRGVAQHPSSSTRSAPRSAALAAPNFCRGACPPAPSPRLCNPHPSPCRPHGRAQGFPLPCAWPPVVSLPGIQAWRAPSREESRLMRLRGPQRGRRSLPQWSNRALPVLSPPLQRGTASVCEIFYFQPFCPL